MKHLRLFEQHTTKTKVLYFNSNTKKNFFNLYMLLRGKFDNLDSIDVNDVDNFLLEISDDRWYVKELPYQIEVFNTENECVFCINKPI